MRPHEEKWVVDEQAVNDGDYTAVDPEGFCVLTTYARGDVEDGDEVAETRLRLAVAAPDMARALLALLAEKQGVIMTRAEADLFTAAQMALTKAGVLP